MVRREGGFTPLWNLIFHIWHTVETWISSSPWQKEIVDNVITLVTWLICNLQTKPFSNKLTLSSWWHRQSTLFVISYPRCKFELHTMSGSITMEAPYFSLEKLSKLSASLRSCSLRTRRCFKLWTWGCQNVYKGVF